MVTVGGLYNIPFIILATVPIYWIYWPIVNCSILTLWVLHFFRRWCQFNENDMSSMQLHGPFKAGFKTFKSEENGNDCLLYYPVDKSS